MDNQDLLNYTHQNLASWDEAAPLHAEINRHLLQEVQKADYSNFDQYLTKLVDTIDVAALSCVQICCNNGIDLISLKKKGAGFCLGIDGSPAFIKQAQELGEKAGVSDIKFARHNIYELPDSLREQFDIALITVGVINWMPDLNRFMEVCSSLLKPGGKLVMEEIHPILSMYIEGEPSHIGASYFDKTPYEDESGLDYFNATTYKAKKNFWFNHSLSEILMSAIKAGLYLGHIEELAKNIGNYCADLEQAEYNPPLGFTAVWNKIN